MKTILEALVNRDEDYSNVCDTELKNDARRDLLKLLNVFTDIERPSKDDIKAMHDISESIYHLCCYCNDNCEETNKDTDINEEIASLSESEKWKTVYPKVNQYLSSMVTLMSEFMECKTENKSCPEKIKEIFNCHKNLAQAVMTINNITQEEREVIQSFISGN